MKNFPFSRYHFPFIVCNRQIYKFITLKINGTWKMANGKLYGGQALITLLFYVVILITVSTAAVLLMLMNSQSTTKLQEGLVAYYVAESGAENALLRVLRDPNYTGETAIPIGEGNATIVVTPGSPTTILSTGTVGDFIRKIQVVANYSGGSYTITSWQEVE